MSNPPPPGTRLLFRLGLPAAIALLYALLLHLRYRRRFRSGERAPDAVVPGRG
ncbi:hypothetical protein ACIHCM_14405 [Streptomyces sp. NPDC052023]|uniref:hypothetical protein n=1 Tax=Streptomyces sp. NPDC052023 TaxID=3365681 RepID=UPI0037D6EFAF